MELLRLTADLHAATGDPQRWSVAWAALCQWVGCPEIFGDGSEPANDHATLLAGITMRSANARQCARTGGGLCGKGGGADDDKRDACRALVEHLDVAIDNSRATSSRELADAYLAALDVLPVAMILCHAERQFAHANRAGRIELERQRWLRLENDTLHAIGGITQQRLVAAFQRLSQAPAGDTPTQLQTVHVAGNAADIGIRRLGEVGGKPLMLISLVAHDAELSEAQLSSVADRRRLPPRQRELAGLLLAGHSLDAAAEIMGITRRTARDHLEGLFRATDTRRQQDLIARLTRDANC